MAINPLLHIVNICLAIIICTAEKILKAFANGVGCQHRSSFGRDYRGTANTTETGIPCQKWSDTQPHEHKYTFVGDHNFCRNSAGSGLDKVACFTSDPNIKVDYCSVPVCPPLKVLDFSLDGDWKSDANGTYTHASSKGKPPSLFHHMCCFHGGMVGIEGAFFSIVSHP